MEYLDSIKNIYHRDIKPQNIYVKNGIIKIGDWGTSRYFDIV